MEVSLSELEAAYAHFGYVRTDDEDMVEFLNETAGVRYFHSPADEGIDYDLVHIVEDIAQYDAEFARRMEEHLSRGRE